ncbi:translation initiation factor IF-2 N-terminal domain-containing protein [Clostridium senegalense]
MGIKVYELASMLGLTNEQMLEILWENNIKITNQMSTVEEEDKEKILKELRFETDLISHENKSSLKWVEVNGLFNKYDYKLEFHKDINIFVAENGFGKTTILNIIVATLEGDINKLRKLSFKSVKFGFQNKVIEIEKKELADLSLYKYNDEYFWRKIRRVLPAHLYARMKYDYHESGDMDLDEFIYKYGNYIKDDYLKHELGGLLWNKNNSLNKVSPKLKNIKGLIKDEPIYLPTYRRIEEELDNFIKLSTLENRTFKSKFDSSTINFGMEDVERIIIELTEKLKNDAINHYSIMNGEILDDLLSNKISLSRTEKRKIDIEKIKIVIGRIGEDRIKKLSKLMNFIENDKNSGIENENFLEYYLYKLINIYKNQKPIDDKIKRYRDVCNKYLINKKIVYDEVTTRVYIKDEELNSDNELKFSQLSSGEKQILSLFARLYLEVSKPVIFIIDEPELSLSMVWQKMLLEDIYNSGKIALLITTTHSPFIFKNKYRNFAKDLKMFRRKSECIE